MTGERGLFCKFVHIKGGHVDFAGANGGNITGIGVVSNGKITLEKVNFVEQLQHNLMSVSQICDKENSVHFTKDEALVLKPGFVAPDEWIVMRAPRTKDLYLMDMSVADPAMEATCLLSKASESDSILWHRRMAHLHYRKMNYITRHGLVQGVPMKNFVSEDKCVPCLKGKQQKKPHKSKTVNSIASPFELLHMDLFGPINVRSVGGKHYCLVVTDDYSRYSWVFFLATKGETVGILTNFFVEAENVYKTKIRRIRSDNGTEFKNNAMEVFCLSKGIQHQFSAPYTPQQNGVLRERIGR